jgi:hypothetical protein
MNPKVFAIVLAAALAAAVGIGYALQGGGAAPTPTNPGPAASRPTSVPTPPVQAPVSSGKPAEAELPPEAFINYPPGKYLMKIPFTKSGIDCGDGRFLPLLNGVPSAGKISRQRDFGPVPPVVGKIVDDKGVHYWLHADDSTTTTRWVEQTDANGVKSMVIVTDHAAKVPDKFGVETPPPGPGEGAKK